MKSTERIIWITVVSVLLVLFLYTRSELNQVSEWISEQNAQLKSLDEMLDQALNTYSEEGYDRLSHLFESDIRLLKESGLDSPEADLRTDLMSKNELIAFEGIHGGTMRIYSEDQIILLPGNYVMAVFEDGHIQGGMLLEYSVKDGVITWKRLTTKLF